MVFHRKFLHATRKTKTIAILFGLITIIEGVLWYFLPLYFESQLNSLFLVSFLVSLHPIASTIAELPAGDICDKIGRKFVFIIGVAGFLFSFIFLMMDNFLGFFLFMMTYGAFSALYALSSYVSTVDYSDGHYVGGSASFTVFFVYLGWFIGSILGGILLSLLNQSMIINILVIFLFILLSGSIFFFPGRSGISFKGLRKAEKAIIKDKIWLGEIKSIRNIGVPVRQM